MTIGRGIIAAFILAVAGLTAASAGDQNLLERCWTPEALSHSEKELKPGRATARFDLAALKEAAPDTATPVPPELRGSIRSVELPQGEKLIALTFDLCESGGGTAGYDGRIVDQLRAQGVKATFFTSGKWLETHPERAQQLIADPNSRSARMACGIWTCHASAAKPSTRRSRYPRPPMPARATRSWQDNAQATPRRQQTPRPNG